MNDLDSNELVELEAELMKVGVDEAMERLERSTDRLKKLIELKAPKCITDHEIKMIRYRVLCVQQALDFWEDNKCLPQEA